MDVVDAINNEYGENPDQSQIQMQGNAYLEKVFPKLDYIKSATIVPQSRNPFCAIETSRLASKSRSLDAFRSKRKKCARIGCRSEGCKIQ